jgi:hypothetical protein
MAPASRLWMCILIGLSWHRPLLHADETTDEASLGIAAYFSSWQHSAEVLQQQFDSRGLPPVSVKGIFITGFGTRHAEGLQLRDVVFEISGKKFSSDAQLALAMSRLRPGVKCKVKVKRYEENEARAQWRTVVLDVVPLSKAELEAELRAWREKYRSQVFKFSSGYLFKTGQEIDELNESTLKQVEDMRLDLSVRRTGLSPRGPNDECVTTGISNVSRVIGILTQRDQVTGKQNREESLEAAKEFVRELYVSGQGADEEFVVSTVFGGLIVTFDDGTAFFYREIWQHVLSMLKE